MSFKSVKLDARRVERDARLDAANRVVSSIAQTGTRLFFYAPIARVAVLAHENDRVFWFDEYTGSRVYTHSARAWYGFSHGSGVRRVVESLRDYIMNDQRIEFASWRRVLGDLGYDEAAIAAVYASALAEHLCVDESKDAKTT